MTPLFNVTQTAGDVALWLLVRIPTQSAVSKYSTGKTIHTRRSDRGRLKRANYTGLHPPSVNLIVTEYVRQPGGGADQHLNCVRLNHRKAGSSGVEIPTTLRLGLVYFQTSTCCYLHKLSSRPINPHRQPRLMRQSPFSYIHLSF
jgi:hypothetical protein